MISLSSCSVPMRMPTIGVSIFRSPVRSYPELFRVTGPLLSLVFRTEDVCVFYLLQDLYTKLFGGRRVEDMCVCFVYYQPNSSHRGGPLSRPPAGCALGSASVGNPFDRVWPPTTSGDLQPIFSCVDLLLDSRGTHPIGVLWDVAYFIEIFEIFFHHFRVCLAKHNGRTTRQRALLCWLHQYREGEGVRAPVPAPGTRARESARVRARSVAVEANFQIPRRQRGLGRARRLRPHKRGAERGWARACPLLALLPAGRAGAEAVSRRSGVDRYMHFSHTRLLRNTPHWARRIRLYTNILMY